MEIFLVLGGMLAFMFYGIKAILEFIVFLVEFITALIYKWTE